MAGPLTVASAGLLLASTTSTRYAALRTFTAAEASRGNSFVAGPTDPADPDEPADPIYQNPDDYDPVPADLKARLQPQLYALCLMMRVSTSSGPTMTV